MTDPKSPQMGHFRQSLTTFAERRGLTDTRAAGLLGVPVSTYRKWTTGTRAPSAATVRLLDVFCTLEVMAPTILDALTPDLAVESGHVEKSNSVMSKNPL